MAYYDWGNAPIHSTQALQASPSTATLCAELDSTELGTATFKVGQNRLGRVTFIVGCASTITTWLLEHATSTGLGSTATDSTSGGNVWTVLTPTGQSGQYMQTVNLTLNSRLRARVVSTVTNAAANICFEPMT